MKVVKEDNKITNTGIINSNNPNVNLQTFEVEIEVNNKVSNNRTDSNHKNKKRLNTPITTKSIITITILKFNL